MPVFRQPHPIKHGQMGEDRHGHEKQRDQNIGAADRRSGQKGSANRNRKVCKAKERVPAGQ